MPPVFACGSQPPPPLTPLLPWTLGYVVGVTKHQSTPILPRETPLSRGTVCTLHWSVPQSFRGMGHCCPSIGSCDRSPERVPSSRMTPFWPTSAARSAGATEGDSLEFVGDEISHETRQAEA